MFYEPTVAFISAKTGKGVLLPLFFLSFLPAIIYYWYFQTVDMSWLVDRTLATQSDVKPDDVEVARAFMANSLKWLTIVASVVATPAAIALYGLYLFLFANRGTERLSYSKWFAFAVWTNVPKLLLLPLMAVQIVTSAGHVTLEELNIASLNFLVFKLPADNPWVGLLSSIDLSTLWIVALSVIGVRAWTRRSVGAACVITVIPYVVIYGTWAAKIVFFG